MGSRGALETVAMFIDFLYQLRAAKVPVGTQEGVALARALSLGLHQNSLEGFYFLSRAIFVHREAHLDAFDVAFAQHFRGAAADAEAIGDELLAWLEDATQKPRLTDVERALLQSLDLEELRRQFKVRLAEQKERHDGGSRFIGTGGTSPFGHAGVNPAGLRIGASSGGRSAVQTADARAYRAYRSDVVLDVRQIELALRKLRAFTREGTRRELDLEATIDATAKSAGDLEIVTRPPRRSSTRVLLLMDVGGSMDPHSESVSQLFSAAKRATHFKELRTYYFHNCVYGSVCPTEDLADEVPLTDLVASAGRHYKLIIVGDALMAAYELLDAPRFGTSEKAASGLAWLFYLRDQFDRAVWLNPEPPAAWPRSTIETIAGVFPMFPLTLDGLGDAVKELVRGASR
jgi:uncharacterized protein with von Willebrand factor type A (vWA) domain